MSGSFEQKLAEKAKGLGFALKDPAKIAERLGQWVSENYPERVRQALWVTVSGDRDKGLEVELLKRPVGLFESLRLSALLGRETWGGGMFVDVWEGVAGSRHVVASLGVGAVKPYTGGAWAAVAAVSFRF